MQILIQVVAVPGTKSLRTRINNDAKLKDFGLEVHYRKKVERREGWTKLHSLHQGVLGAINVEWDASVSILMCRVATKSVDIPQRIIGDFVQYLFARFGDDIESINIIHRG